MRAAWLLFVPVALGAQQEASSACRPAHTPDSLTVVVTAQLTPFDPAQPVPASYPGLLLDEIVFRLQLPRPFVVSTWFQPDSIGGQPNKDARAFAGLFAMVAITLHEGSIKARLASTSAVPAFDAALLRAVESVGADATIAPLPDSLRTKTLDLRLLIQTTETPGSSDALFRLRVPVARVSKPVSQRPGTMALRYPDELRRQHVEGSVVVQFVVNEEGKPLGGSIRVLKATHLLFAQNVVEAVPRARYLPAEIGGCPVAVVVQQPFNFSLRY